MTIETLYQQMLAAMGPGTGSKPESHLPRRLGRFSGAVFSFRIPTGATWITHWLI
ncbi:hypothetical protein N574_0117245 [Lactiplantibacillus plantarum 2165]|nr:hypothetical protein N574_0117245 [Lactiplantibacillus plantarum 2165]